MEALDAAPRPRQEEDRMQAQRSLSKSATHNLDAAETAGAVMRLAILRRREMQAGRAKHEPRSRQR